MRRTLFRYRSFNTEKLNDYSYIHQRIINIEKWKFEAKKYVFEEKKRVYESIIVFAQIVLFPAEAKFSLGVARYNIQELSDDENRNNAINDLKMAIPKLKLISKDDGLVKELDKFIHQKSEEQFNILVNRLRKDLYK